MTNTNNLLYYRVVPHNGGLVFSPPKLAQRLNQIHRALAHAQSWAEFRTMMPPDDYREAMEHSFDIHCEERPDDADPFSADRIGGWSDGDYPHWLQKYQERFIPKDVLERFGKITATHCNGDYWDIPPEHELELVATLEAVGIQAVKMQDLRFF